ncbi:Fur family transcriptional regulator [Chloroflexota bacterium]
MQDKYETRLRARGYRMTPQREMIIAALTGSDHHVTAEEIFKVLHERTHALNIATVYRTLDLLVEEGLVCRNNLGGDRVYYAPLRHGPHIHLVCRHCGQVIEADYSQITSLNGQLQEQYGFAADLQHVSFFGVCETCQSKEQVEN